MLLLWLFMLGNALLLFSSTISLYVNKKAHVANNFNCFVENEGLLKVKGSSVNCECGNSGISENGA